MRRYIVIAILAVVLTVLPLAACNGPDLSDISVTELTYADTGFADGENWNGAQGLTTDGTYIYFASQNDKLDAGASIHVIDIQTFKEVNVFEKTGPRHGAELYYHAERDTVFACSGGNNVTPYVYELNKTNGEKINSWDFEGKGENGGALITFDKDGNLILFTSSSDGANIAFAVVRLGENGSYEIISEHKYSEMDLGVPQGLEYYNGKILYLADAGKTVSANPHYIYEISLKDNNAIGLDAAYQIKIKFETEGLAIAPDGKVYFGTAEEEIFVFDKAVSEW